MNFWYILCITLTSIAILVFISIEIYRFFSCLSGSGESAINMNYKDFVALYYADKDNWHYNYSGSKNFTSVFYYQTNIYGSRIVIKFKNYFDFCRARNLMRIQRAKKKKERIIEEQIKNYSKLLENITPRISQTKDDGQKYMERFNEIMQKFESSKQ